MLGPERRLTGPPVTMAICSAAEQTGVKIRIAAKSSAVIAKTFLTSLISAHLQKYFIRHQKWISCQVTAYYDLFSIVDEYCRQPRKIAVKYDEKNIPL
jgi:hypothetical protein